MAESFKSDRRTSSGAPSGEGPLDAVLGRLDGLVDWERRSRSGASGRLMRQSVTPARDLLDRLGAPDRALGCVLIAGTKGKGSVASLVAAALTAAGERTGLYTSPHVERVQERVRIDGLEVADADLAAALTAALDAREVALAEEAPGGDATWFDVLTAAALSCLRRADVRWAVLECGLGGRLDSTNAVEPKVAVVTNVALEHTAILGSTRAEIAGEKAGIARRGVPLVSGVGPPGDEAADVVRSTAESLGARLVAVEVEAERTVGAENQLLARAVLEELGFPPIADEEVWTAAARLPGRLERVRLDGVEVVLDGAHVPGSLERIFDELSRQEGLSGPPVVVLATGEDKDVPGLLKVLRGRVDRVLCTSLGRGPYAHAERIAQEADRLDVPARVEPDPETALHMALQTARPTTWVLVTGSLHLVGRLRFRVLAPMDASR